jgi:GNAT superfamily N-acetyltransferase
MTVVPEPAYVSCMVVRAAHRGSGVGGALVRRANAALAEAGVMATLLHYSGLNPLSPPFWHRCGFRPLWTTWELRPASRLR